MIDLKVRRDVHGHTVILGTPSQTIVPAELNVSLSWATPHIMWPQNMGITSRSRMGANTSMNEEYRYIRKHSSHTPTINRSSFSMHGEHNIAGNVKEDHGNDGTLSNLAIAFESLYGRMYLSNVLCPRVEALLAVGAYSHRLSLHQPLTSLFSSSNMNPLPFSRALTFVNWIPLLLLAMSVLTMMIHFIGHSFVIFRGFFLFCYVVLFNRFDHRSSCCTYEDLDCCLEGVREFLE